MTDCRLLKVEEVAVTIGSSVQSINNWYRFKKQNPDNEFAQLLPEYIQQSERMTRYWRDSDIWKLIEFKQSIPQGCKGIMGSVTQKYHKKEKQNGKV